MSSARNHERRSHRNHNAVHINSGAKPTNKKSPIAAPNLAQRLTRRIFGESNSDNRNKDTMLEE